MFNETGVDRLDPLVDPPSSGYTLFCSPLLLRYCTCAFKTTLVAWLPRPPGPPRPPRPPPGPPRPPPPRPPAAGVKLCVTRKFRLSEDDSVESVRWKFGVSPGTFGDGMKRSSA